MIIVYFMYNLCCTVIERQPKACILLRITLCLMQWLNKLSLGGKKFQFRAKELQLEKINS